LSKTGSLQWLEQVDGNEIVYDQEPRTGWWRRAAVAVVSWFPIDWLL
jgi:cardiolipin synthase C